MSDFETIHISTRQKIEFVDITDEVKRFITGSRMENGLVVVYTPHTTAAITINENADPAVTKDMKRFFEKLVPHESYFAHMEGNSPAHIMSSLVSASETLIVDQERLVLGTWQGIYFCEFDGPRTRKIHLKNILSDR